MTSDRLFMDTAFVVALLNPKDDLHEKAKSQFDAVKKAREVWTTEAVLFESTKLNRRPDSRYPFSIGRLSSVAS